MPIVDLGGASVFYTDDAPRSVSSDRAPIVMVHGFAKNGTWWSGWMPRLNEQHRVVRPDIRGCGRSPDPGPDFVYRIEDVVSDLMKLLDHLELDRVHYVGEATGGIAGGIAAATYPDRFHSLTLVCTPVNTRKSDVSAKSVGSASPEEAMRRLGMREWWLRSRLPSDLFGDERDEAMADELALTPVHVAVEMWTRMHMTNVDLQPYLEKILVPTFLMVPTASTTMSAADQISMASSIPNATYKVYEGEPHGVYYLKPDMMAADYIRFVESL